MQAARAEITQVECQFPVLPVLKGATPSPVARLHVRVEGDAPVAAIASVTVNVVEPTRTEDIESIELRFGGSSPTASVRTTASSLAEMPQFAAPQPPQLGLQFAGRQELVEGDNYLWLACTLRPEANLDHRISFRVSAIELADGQCITVEQAASQPLRIGTAVRRQGDDGVHTYRIPGLATANDGALIAVYDVRRRGGGDLPGDIDVGMSKSVDGGTTWSPMQIIIDMGNDRRWAYDGVGDPAILVDRETGTLWVAALWSHGNRGWNGSQPGMDPDETGQLVLVRSDDNGDTWSAPRNITPDVKDSAWSLLLQGPGRGITMHDGTLVFAAQFQDAPAAKRLPRSTILYSRDHGETWQIGAGGFDDTTEAQVVELSPGRLMLNCRYNREANRVVLTTDDFGATWQEHPTSRGALIEPGACMASLLRVDPVQQMPSAACRLLFSNPDSTRQRHRMSIKSSIDGGASWPESRHLLLDEFVGGGYSCLTRIDDENIGILFEGSQAPMTFLRFPIAELFK